MIIRAFISPIDGQAAVVVVPGRDPDDMPRARALGRLCEHFSLVTWEEYTE